MKKFALILICVFTIFGGLLLSSCGNPVELSLDTQSVVIYTNDNDVENYKQKTITFSMKNSAGAYLEVLSGADCIYLDQRYATHTSGDQYSFTIHAIQSGKAKIRVSAVDDKEKYQIIDVVVNTVIERIDQVQSDNVENRSNRFVIRGDAAGREIRFSEFFNFEPVTANINDTVLAFDETADGGFVTYLGDPENPTAEIKDDKLFVYDSYAGKTITFRAYFVENHSVNENITFDILEKATISSLSLNDSKIEIIKDGEVVGDNVELSLKRNDSNLSNFTGELTANSSHPLELKPVFERKLANGSYEALSENEWTKYFNFSIEYLQNADGKYRYDFAVDALVDTQNNWETGQFLFSLQVQYEGYDYAVSTKNAPIAISTDFVVESFQITNHAGDLINDAKVEVFSSYNSTYGYETYGHEMHVLMKPENVTVDETFALSVNLKQNVLQRLEINGENVGLNNFSRVLKFFNSHGKQIDFVNDVTNTDRIVSMPIANNETIYALAGDGFGNMLDNLQVDFVWKDDDSATERIQTMNFELFKIGSNESIDVTVDGQPLQDRYIPSNKEYEPRNVEFLNVRVDGFSSLNGLEIVHDNLSRFEFSELELERSSAPQENPYIVVNFTVTLLGSDFTATSTFHFQHITGKRSEELHVYAFVPLESASVSNGNKQSSSVFEDSSLQQAFFVNEYGAIEQGKGDLSLARLTMEAGSNLQLYFDCNTSAEAEISIKYLPVWTKVGEPIPGYDENGYNANFVALVSPYLDGKSVEEFFNNSDNLNVVVGLNLFSSFGEDYSNLFTLSRNGKLSVSNNSFKGYVAVSFKGWKFADSVRQEFTLVRIFALESMVSVRSLSSNFKEVTLYTTETLSIADLSRSYVDVTISLRNDQNIPTYTNNLDYFTFVSGKLSSLQDNNTGFDINSSNFKANEYYEISNVAYRSSGRLLSFTITAKSTKFDSRFEDILHIYYDYKDNDLNTYICKTDIKLNILNVDRVESVIWANKTEDGEIYLNTFATDISERTFIVSATVKPNSAENKGLKYYYDSPASANSFEIQQVGQTFNLTLNDSENGGAGYLYLLPEDMIKYKDSREQILLYEKDEDGNLKAKYIPFAELTLNFDDIVGNGETDDDSGHFVNYFKNNNGEKVYNRDVILRIRVIIADGKSEETAIRIYTADGLAKIQNTSRYYEIMNNLSLSNWKTLKTLSGGIFGRDSSITLTFTGDSQTFVGNLTSTGTLHDLTLAGNVTSLTSEAQSENFAGFAANVNSGTIKNVVVDVYYSLTDKKFQSSTLSVAAGTNVSAVGGLVGFNNGQISSSTVGGLSIELQSVAFGGSNSVGGLVGKNSGTVEQSSFEFYVLDDGYNKISAPSNVAIGGIVGHATGSSKIYRSYAYAYPATDNSVTTDMMLSGGSVGAFAGKDESGAKVEQSFAFLGGAENVSSTSNMAVTNSYIAYISGGSKYVKLFGTNSRTQFTFSSKNQSEYSSAVSAIKEEKDAEGDLIWVTEDIDENINFGFMYLAKNTQNVAVDINFLAIKDNVEPLQTISADADKGILFRYALADESLVLNAPEQSALDRKNTIRIQDLFEIDGKALTENQARSLLVSTSSNSNLLVGTNSIQVRNKTLNEIQIYVRSKMNLTSSKPFSVMILEYLPTLSTTIESEELEDDQILLLQTNTSKTVLHNLDNSVSVNGTIRELKQDKYVIDFAFPENSDKHIDEFLIGQTSNSTSVLLTGANKHTSGTTKVETFVQIGDKIGSDFQNAIKNVRKRAFGVQVYDGATALAIENAEHLNFKVSETATFTVKLETDNAADGLEFSLKYDDRTFLLDENKFKIDDNLWLDVSQSTIEKLEKENGAYMFRYRVLVSVSQEKKHLVAHSYDDMELVINATSQMSTKNFEKSLTFSVLSQEIEDVAISLYSIDGRTIRNSRMYYRLSSNIINTLSPSSDAIVAVTVSPAYAKMTHFTLTQDAPDSMISISKLSYNSSYDYYNDSANSSSFENGVRVDLSDADRQGSGIYYFRVYVSGAMSVDRDVKLTANFYGGSEIYTRSQSFSVDYLPRAQVLVDGSSTALLSKGSKAVVTIDVGLDQTLYGLRLDKANSQISITDWHGTDKVVGNSRQYTVTLSASIMAQVYDDVQKIYKPNGVFYVTAQVQRFINGVQEIKSSRAVVCLVDFAVDADNISLFSDAGTATFGGQQYDVFHSYVGANDTLRFNYPITPEDYEYDPLSEEEVDVYEKLMAERKALQRDNSYKNDETEYYINYSFDNQTGNRTTPLTLKQQLYFVNDGIETPIYNENYGTIMQERGGYFTISEKLDRNENPYIEIHGNKPHARQGGGQLMRLRTFVKYQDIEITYNYDFLIVVSTWTDEETPTQIFSGEELLDYATNGQVADDYILMNDIVLENYTPLDTDLIKSLDGNGYTIHLNSFNIPASGNLNLALFNNVKDGTTLKNVRVNIYGAGQIAVDVNAHKEINIAGFAITNDGIIYNCEVVSYFSDLQTTTRTENGIVVTYTNGANGDPFEMTDAFMQRNEITSNVAGFAIENNASIVNSRVGGESFKRIINIEDRQFMQTVRTDVFHIQGQGGNKDASTGGVAGFIIQNHGQISACFAKNVQIDNKLKSINSLSAGFILSNDSNVQTSYVEGNFVAGKDNVSFTGTTINTRGYVGGFVYQNIGKIKNSYANIAVGNNSSVPAYSAGFVYENSQGAQITLCFTACQILSNDLNQMPFSGVSTTNENLNYGEISFSYFYNAVGYENTNQNTYTSGATPVMFKQGDKQDRMERLYGFSFATKEDSYDGIWTTTDNGITLVEANKIAMSSRYAVKNGEIVSMLYNRTITELETYDIYDLEYGTINNPFIIRNAYDFAVATGMATSKHVNSAYEEFYTDDTIFGNYRFVNNVDLSEIDQDIDDASSGIKLTTTQKAFKGLLDGNGFAISNLNINLGNTFDDRLKNFGLFETLENAVVMNLDMNVVSVLAKSAHLVGSLAGSAYDSRIVSVSIKRAQEQQDNIRILGENIVGGVVGALFGQSRMIDVNAEDIRVEASYWDKDKQIGDNDKATANLQISTARKETLDVETLSYGGAIAGFVDVNNFVNSSSFATYDQDLVLNNFDIINIKGNDAVSVFAEVAGGLFGYVGKTTYIYDAGLVLGAGLNLGSPSYIASTNLYAGGIIGESYGGIFGAFANLTESLTDDIEENAYNYYSGNSGVERGQQTIFSFTAKEPELSKTANSPKYIGGLIGLIGGGFVTKAQSKLNVISYSKSTIAAGGIAGVATSVGNKYALKKVTDTPSVDIYFDEVYASGDVHIEGQDADATSSSAGLVGAIYVDALHGATQIAMKKSLAVNLRAVDFAGNNIMGDVKVADAEIPAKYWSKNHFVLFGRVIGSETITPYPYIIDQNNDFYDLALEERHGALDGILDVGGFSSVKFQQNTIYMKFFGFGTDLSKNQKDQLIEVKPMGDLQGMPAAYSYLSRFFLQSEWDAKYWEHKQDHLFPNYRILPIMAGVIFWDQDNTLEIMQVVQNHTADIIVVRGRASHTDEQCTDYGDINLLRDFDIDTQTTGTQLFQTFQEFDGELISFKEYYDGALNNGITDGHTHRLGGNVGEDPGLIFDIPLFANADGMRMTGLNLYFCSSNGNTVQPEIGADGAKISYSLIQNRDKESIVSNATFTKNRLVLNADVEITTKSFLNGHYAAGLVAGVSYATSYVETTVETRHKERQESSITFVHGSQNAFTAPYMDVSMGVLSGEIEQNSPNKAVTITGIDFVDTAVDSDVSDRVGKVKVNYIFKNSKNEMGATVPFRDVNLGLYVGSISKSENGTARINLRLGKSSNNTFEKSSNDVQLLICADGYISGTEKENVNFETMNVGGAVGSVVGADEVSYSASSNSTSTDIYVHESVSANILAAGLAFGALETHISIRISDLSLRGGIYQLGNNGTMPTAILGAFAGKAQGDILINGGKSEFNVAKALLSGSSIAGPAWTYTFGEGAEEFSKNLFDLNVQNYENVYLDENGVPVEGETGNIIGLSPFVVQGKQDDSIGGLIGYVTGGNLVLNGEFEIAGNLDIQISPSSESGGNKTVDVGGVIGKFAGEQFSTTMSAGSRNNINISVCEDKDPNGGTANVGGIIGEVVSELNEEDSTLQTISINQGQSAGSFAFDGNVLSNVKNLVFGGAIAKLPNSEFSEGSGISRVSFGGAIKLYGEWLDGGEVTVGGVLGERALKTSDTYKEMFIISECFSYGDVFANYGNDNSKLKIYNLGGIAGSAAGIEIDGCISMMTNFNSRIQGKDKENNLNVNAYNVGAIVGDENQVAYAAKLDQNSKPLFNYYSSMVCMAYQENENCVDLQYSFQNVSAQTGENDKQEQSYRFEYFGYSNWLPKYEENGKISDVDGRLETVVSTQSILDKATALNLMSVSDVEYGSKLKPYPFVKNSGQFALQNGQCAILTKNSAEEGGEEYDSQELSSTHNITWVSLEHNFDNMNSDYLTHPLMQYVVEDTNATSQTQEFVNMAFVGNGRTMKLSDTRSGMRDNPLQYAGALLDVMGKQDKVLSNFSMISGLVLDVEFSANMNFDSKNQGASGGVVGRMEGNSFIYGVGVEGDISVGASQVSEALKVDLGGIVGDMQSGLVKECYMDAHIVYRNFDSYTEEKSEEDGPTKQVRNDFGRVSGVANVGANAVATIMSTYSAGEILTYVDAPIYTFAYGCFVPDLTGDGKIATETKTTNSALVDVYSYTQVRKEPLNDWHEENDPVFVNEYQDTQGGKASTFEIFNAYNGSYGVKNGSASVKAQNATNMAVNYSQQFKILNADNTQYDSIVKKENYLTNLHASSATDGAVTVSAWYFSPYTNNGYAAHGFGYLKNASTYTRKVVENEAAPWLFRYNGDKLEKQKAEAVMQNSKAVTEYEYKEVSYADILKYGMLDGLFTGQDPADESATRTAQNKWFLGVANLGKFAQMTSAAGLSMNGSTGQFVPRDEYKKDFRFVLENDIDMKIVQSGSGDDAEKMPAYDPRYYNVGDLNKDFILDGANHTVSYKDFVASTQNPLEFFGRVNGSIENLKLNEINVKNGATLADVLNGSIFNVTVVGSVTSSNKVVGGVVGTLNGSATAVTSIVNITATSGGVVGGIAGNFGAYEVEEGSSVYVFNNGTISYSSNAGQIKVTGTSAGKEFGYITQDGGFAKPKTETEGATDNKKFGAIVGGIVGYAEAENGSLTIQNSYNSNSVLSGYTNSLDANYVAGGIVGYANGTKDNPVTIDETENTGFVGAGNYGEVAKQKTDGSFASGSKPTHRSEGYAFAGGIVGYGNCVALSRNINDAGVEALGDMPELLTNSGNGELDYSVSIEIVEGNPEDNNGVDKDGYATGPDSSDNWTKDYAYTESNGVRYEKKKQGEQKELDPLRFAVTLTYNPGRDRKVYAYGIGFVNGLTATNLSDNLFKDNYTSTNNVKNDGCIGQVEERRIITFDRQSMYAGVDWDELADFEKENIKATILKNFWASFYTGTYLNDSYYDNLDLYYVNGFDSYGFPMHIYKTDTMVRTYGRILENVNVGTRKEISDSPFSQKEVAPYTTDTWIYHRPGYRYYGTNGEFYATFDNEDFENYYEKPYTIVDNDIFNEYKNGVYSDDIGYVSYYYKGVIENGEVSSSVLDETGSIDATDSRWADSFTSKILYGDQTFNKNNSANNFLGREDSYKLFTFEDFLMKQQTLYAESASFVGYDEILTGIDVHNDDLLFGEKEEVVTNTGFGLVAFDASRLTDTRNVTDVKGEDVTDKDGKTLTEFDTASGKIDNRNPEQDMENTPWPGAFDPKTRLEEKISDINARVENSNNNSGSVFIGGKVYSLVENGYGLKQATGAYMYTGEVEFYVADFDPKTVLTENNFKVAGALYWEFNKLSEENNMRGYTIDIPNTSNKFAEDYFCGKVKMWFKAWMSTDNAADNLQVSFSYKSKDIETTLANPNIRVDSTNNYLYLIFEDEQGQVPDALQQVIAKSGKSEQDLAKMINENKNKTVNGAGLTQVFTEPTYKLTALRGSGRQQKDFLADGKWTFGYGTEYGGSYDAYYVRLPFNNDGYAYDEAYVKFTYYDTTTALAEAEVSCFQSVENEFTFINDRDNDGKHDEYEYGDKAVKFKGFEETTVQALGLAFEEVLSETEPDPTDPSPEPTNVEKRLCLTDLQSSANGKMAIGPADETYGLTYTKEAGWAFYGSWASGLQFSFSAGSGLEEQNFSVLLQIKDIPDSEGDTQKKYLSVSGSADAVAAFEELFQNLTVYRNKSGNISAESLTGFSDTLYMGKTIATLKGLSDSFARDGTDKIDISIRFSYKLLSKYTTKNSTEGFYYNTTASGGSHELYYYGNNFDEYTDDDAQITSTKTSHFGIDFVTKEVTFKYRESKDGRRLLSSGPVFDSMFYAYNNSLGFEILDENNRTVALGSFQSQSMNSIDLVIEKNYKIKVQRTIMHKDADFHTENGVATFVYENGDVRNEYLISRESGTLAGLNGTYYKTYKPGYYEFRVYNNGGFSVLYTFQKNRNSDREKEQHAVLFVWDGENILWNEGDIDNIYNVGNFKEWKGNENPFEAYTYSGYETITVDVIASYIGSSLVTENLRCDSVAFARNAYADNASDCHFETTKTAIGEFTSFESTYETFSNTVNSVTSGDYKIRRHDSSVSLTTERLRMYYPAGTLWKAINNSKYTIIGSMPKRDIVYNYTLTESKNVSVTNVNTSKFSWAIYERIILTSDIQLDQGLDFERFSTSDAPCIYGAGHVIKVVGDSVVKNFGGQLKDIKLSVVAELSSSKTGTGSKSNLQPLITLKESEVLTNLTLYGSIRNIPTNLNDYQSILVASASGAGLKNVTNVQSYMVINGLSAEHMTNYAGESASELKDIIVLAEETSEGDVGGEGAGGTETPQPEEDGTPKYVSHNILISGDGGNGSNGSDTGSEKSGKSGGNAGSVTVQYSDKFDGFIKLGAQGKGGFGGNAQNGKYLTQNNLKGGGNGSNGKVADVNYEKEYVDEKQHIQLVPTSVSRQVFQKQYSGNDGTRQISSSSVSYKNSIWPGMNKCSSKVTDVNYTPYNDEQGYGNKIFFNVNESELGTLTDLYDRNADRSRIDENVRSRLKAGSEEDKKIFVSIKTGDQGTGGNLDGIYQIRGVAWTSGESVNCGSYDSFKLTGENMTGNPVGSQPLPEGTVKWEDIYDAAWNWNFVDDDEDGIPDSFKEGTYNSYTGQIVSKPTVEVMLPWDSEYATILEYDENASDPNCKWLSVNTIFPGSKVVWDASAEHSEKNVSGSGNWKYFDNKIAQWRYYMPAGTNLLEALTALIGEGRIPNFPEYMWLYKKATVDDGLASDIPGAGFRNSGKWHLLIDNRFLSAQSEPVFREKTKDLEIHFGIFNGGNLQIETWKTFIKTKRISTAVFDVYAYYNYETNVWEQYDPTV